jgi:hypothetical protein
LERVVMGMMREGVVTPETLVRRLKEASDEGPSVVPRKT